MKLKSLALAVALVALPASSALAQHTTYHQRHDIRARQQRQQARIAHGVQDGQITPRGAAAAERTQAHIASQENQMRSADNGHLTGADRHQLAREQDRASKNIYDRNHNQYTDPGVTPK